MKHLEREMKTRSFDLPLHVNPPILWALSYSFYMLYYDHGQLLFLPFVCFVNDLTLASLP